MSQFERYAPAAAVFYLSCLAMALMFGAREIAGTGSGVTPEMYGPMVYSIPAWIWATVQGSLALAGLFGSLRLKPAAFAIGGIGLSALFLFFGVAAMMAGASGTILVAMAIPASGCAGLCASLAIWGRDGR